MSSFKNVSEETYEKIKGELNSKFNTITYDSTDPSIKESFEIVTLMGKFPVTYYTNGTLLIQGDPYTEDYQKIVEIVYSTLEKEQTR